VSRDSEGDEPMEQQFMPKLMVAGPFSCLKITRRKATVRTVEHP
jgi:hypothetical protein